MGMYWSRPETYVLEFPTGHRAALITDSFLFKFLTDCPGGRLLLLLVLKSAGLAAFPSWLSANIFRWPRCYRK